MITRNRTVLTLAVILGVFTAFSGSLQAAVLVYEPFDYPAGKVDGLAVNAVGLTGTWSANYTDDTASIKANSLTYSTLPTAGNHWGPRGGAVWTSPWIEATLDPSVMSGHLDNGDELWFSFVGNLNISGITIINSHRVQIGADADNNVAIYANKIADGEAEVRASITIGGSETLSTDSVAFTDERRLFVGRVIFGPTDTVEVYLPGPDLVKPENPAGTVTDSIDQSTFDMLRLVVANGNSGVDADEIRIGTKYNDVVGLAAPEKAKDPDPADGVTEVPRDVVLSWTPGDFVGALSPKHKVFLSDNFDDVNDGIGGIAQDAGSYTPAQRLDFNTTFYWRIDEANSTTAWDQGDVWSFTTELLAYPIDGANITATASSSVQGQGPENTVNGLGLDDDRHSTELTEMWLSDSAGQQPTWIQYEFDKTYKLHEMLVWNHNGLMEPTIGVGFKDVTIEYSVNGTDYMTLGTTHEFARASGSADYEHNTTVDFGGAAAKFVRLTPNSNWMGFLVQYGLSEVRFLYIPVFAREPRPDSGAADVAIEVILGFRAGREAAKHDVYLSTDEQAVIDGTAPVTTVTENSYSTPLDLDSTYYWRVDEVNDAETPTTWQGEIWNLSTPEFLVVDDFEFYNDLNPEDPDSNRIFNTWIDGYGIATNGSLVGNDVAPFAEQSIVYDGKQSMPLFYDNSTAGNSEATANVADLQVVQDWTEHGIKALTIRFFGDPNNAVEQMYVEVNGSKVTYDGDAENIRRTAWQMWYIDLSSLSVSNVTQLSIGFDRIGAVGGQGTVYFDDIRLYSRDREMVTPVDPGADGLQLHYELEGTFNDSSVNAHHGTGVGDPVFVAGKIGQAISLDGVDDYINVDGYKGILADANGVQAPFTLSAWIKATSDGEIITWGTNTGTQRMTFRVDTVIRVEHGAGNVRGTSGPDLRDNQWHHVAAVIPQGALMMDALIYVDGVDVTPSSTDEDPFVLTADVDVRIGMGGPTGGRFLTGSIDDARIYDRVLLPEEITYLAGRTEPYTKPF